VSRLQKRVVEIVEQRGLRRFKEPVALASGELSREFVDGKAALAHGADLQTACEAMLESVSGFEFDAVGGLTMGADQFAHVIAVLARTDWFVVRKAPKGRGTNQLIEGAVLGSGVRVLLVDDVVTTGGSIEKAWEAIRETGADVVAVATLVDRGDVASELFAELGVPYFPLVTYTDLGIPPVGRTRVRA
jgi:orotate phosphoribosyltransferase